MAVSTRDGDLDYEALGFKAGLEIHQQLDTTKLFCRDPSVLDEEVEADVVRTLRPTQSELGEVDPAAVEEARKSLVFRYQAPGHAACLVELDEEPPHEMSPEAVDVALTVARLLDMRPVDEVHVMRKIVIDGSNTSGFQRTSLLALDGRVESSLGDVGMATLCLEEDSARKVERAGNLVTYRLDRLGIPLVEIATAPDIKGPAHAREVAEAIGLALRATGRVKRGIGTIRQDLNVSIREGARVELKGVQELRLIPIAIEYEVRRQVMLVDLKTALGERGGDELAARVREAPVQDVSGVFENTAAKLLSGALKRGEKALAIPLPGFDGLIGSKGEATKGDELPPPRFGRELADYAKARAGVKGIFHSDELPAYGITSEEVGALRARLGLGDADAFALVAAPAEQGETALAAVRDRALTAFEGVPEETRDVLDDGASRYMRPLPGGARMYPETDVPPVRVTGTRLAEIESNLPEMPAEKLERWKREYADVSAELQRALVRRPEADLFERLAKETGLAKEAARVILNTLPELEKEGVPVERLDDDALLATFRALEADVFAKEALPAVLRHLAQKGGTPKEAADALGLGAVDEAEVLAAIEKELDSNADLVAQRGMGAMGPLMGPLMGRFKGRVPGEKLSGLLKQKLLERTGK